MSARAHSDRRGSLSRLFAILLVVTTVSTLASVVTTTVAVVSHLQARALRAELDAKWANATRAGAPVDEMTDAQREGWFRQTEPLDAWDVHDGTQAWRIAPAVVRRLPATGGAFLAPAYSGGVSTGYKLFRIRPDSVYALLGLANGDVVKSVNGMPITTGDEARAAYHALKDARTFVVDVSRHGKAVRLEYIVDDGAQADAQR